jgi:two-component system sensor histidine kinase DesK
MLVWLPLLLAEPLAHAYDADPPWPSYLALIVIAVSYVGAGVVGERRFRSLDASRRLVLTGFALLAVQGITTVALVLVSPESALLFPLLAIATVVVLDAGPGLRSIPVVTVLAAVVVLVADRGETRSAHAMAAGVTAVLSGLGCWSFRHLFALIAELARTREELARVAVVQERERFSRDLHDLLGHTLSVIVVKAQAVQRIATSDPAGAAGHAGDIEAIGRRALTEVRQAVEGYRGTGFAAELDRAHAALVTAGIAVTATGPPLEILRLPDDVDALFGWVVREGVTNVVRHSGARSCRVAWSASAEAARLEVTDDGRGAGDGTAGPPASGGLAGLHARVAATGGTLTAASSPGGGFRLAVSVPVPAPDSPPPTPENVWLTAR